MVEPSVARGLGARGGGEVVRCFVCVLVEGSVGSWSLSIGALRDLDQSYQAHACAQLPVTCEVLVEKLACFQPHPRGFPGERLSLP